jgi:cytochrome c2
MQLVIALAGILFTVSVYLKLQDGAITNLTSNQSFFVIAVTLSVFSALLYRTFLKLLQTNRVITDITSSLSVAFGAFVFILLYLDVRFESQDFAISASLIFTSIIILFFPRQLISKISVVIALVLSATILFQTANIPLNPSPNAVSKQYSVKYVFGALQDVKVESLSLSNSVNQDGGAIADVSGEDVLLVTGNGEVLHYNLSKNTMPKRIGTVEFGLESYNQSAANPNRWYRIVDAFLDRESSQLFISYTRWHQDVDCYTINLDSYDFLPGKFAIAGKPNKVFQSSPCIKHDLLNNETGGRILKKDSSSIIFTVGSFKASEKLGLEDYKKSDYGKTFEYIHAKNKLLSFTTGHRNAQGLTQCGNKIYLTEHGPYGGDELNLLMRGNDYGWPESSYGTDYGKKVLTISGETGQHRKGEKPIYAWTPSIGISNLICYQGQAFPNWNNDLLIASLNGLGSGLSIYRTRITEGRAVSIERIELGFKVRDLTELEDGRVLVWDGLNTVSTLSPATSEFANCSGCHNIRFRSHGIGPDLHGVVGAPIARHTDRYKYSNALKGLSGVWTESRLHSFLADPQAFAPGTTMDIEGINDYEKRQSIIDYLKGVSSNR